MKELEDGDKNYLSLASNETAQSPTKLLLA